MDDFKKTNEVYIKCDFCEGLFQTKEVTIEKVKLIGISVDFMRCPFCNHAYPIKYTDKKQKALDEEIAGYTQMIAQRKRLGKNISQARVRRLKSLLEDSVAYQKVLRDKYQTAVTEQLNKIG